MTTKLLSLLGLAIGIIILVVIFSSESGYGALWNFSQQGKFLLPIIAVSSLIDAINPCAFSILFLTIAFLFSLGKPRRDILKTGGVYILGIFVVYILIGLGILQTLQFFNIPNFMGKVGAVAMLLLGIINVLDHYFPSFPIQLKIPSLAHSKIAAYMHKATVAAAFSLGALVGLYEFPCTGGPYLMVLGLLHDQTTYWSGLAYLIFYNVIFVSPLVVILFLAGNETILEKIKRWKSKKLNKSRLVGGMIMIGVSLLILMI